MYEKFEALLKERNITAYRVSQDTGIASGTLTDWKMGRYTPKVDKLIILANYFGVTLDYFLEKEQL